MTDEALNGLIYCGQVLIPSLFPFMVLAEFLSEYGTLDRISFIFSPFCRYILRLPAVAGGAVILSLTGGFPVGAVCTEALYERGKINREQSVRMLRFAVGAGPAFVIFAVGENMLGSKSVGIALYCAQILSQLTVAVIGGILSGDGVPKKDCEKNSRRSFSDTLISSCFKCSDSIIRLCAMVVMFSAFMGIIADVGVMTLIQNLLSFIHIPSPIAQCLMYVLTEVTAGCRRAADCGAPLEFIAFAIGFGGISVHFQIFSLLRRLDFSKLDFFIHRILCGGLCALYTYIITLFMPETAAAISIAAPSGNRLSSSTLIGSMALLLCCSVFLLSMRVGSGNNNAPRRAYNNKRGM